jgi:chaperonin GroES
MVPASWQRPSTMSATAGALSPLLNGAPRPPPPAASAEPPTEDANTAIWSDQETVRERPDMDHARLLKRYIESANIAKIISTERCAEIGNTTKREFDIDWDSCADYRTQYEKWMEMALQAAKSKTYPWPNASNVIYPLITSAAIQFNARAYPAIVRDRNVVKGTVWGPDPDGKKLQRATRIGEHLSWQLLSEQEEWEDQTDKLLIVIAIAGTMFRKSYFDPEEGRNISETCTALQIVVNYRAKSFETAPRLSEIMTLYPYEIEQKIRSGAFLDVEYGTDIDQASMDPDAPVTFIEQHRRIDLDDDGYPEPYIVTIARDSGKLARIVARFDMDGVLFGKSDHRVHKIRPVKYYTPYGFLPNPQSDVYALGFGHLLHPINEAINTSLNQMFDAGHLANAGGGFIGSGLSINTGTVNFQVGEYRVVNTAGGALRDNIVPLQFSGPSQVLFALLQFLVECGKEVAQVKDVMVGDLPGDNVSAATTLAVIEQGLQVFSAIWKRIHRSLKKEFIKLFRLNRLYLDEQSGYQIGDEWREISRLDYEAGAGVEPISDPRMLTDMQRMGRAQFLLQFRGDQFFDQIEIRRRVLDAAQIEGAEKLLKAPGPDPKLLLKAHELDIRQQRETRDLDLRAEHDATIKIREIAQAVLFMAQAQAAENQGNLGWMGVIMDHLKMQLDQINAATDAANNSGAAPAGPATGGPPGGPAPGGLPGMAPPPGIPGSPAVPGP